MLNKDWRESAGREVEQLWHHNGRPVFKFVGIDSISDAEAWRGRRDAGPESERGAAGRGRVFARRSGRLRGVGDADEAIGVGSCGVSRSTVARRCWRWTPDGREMLIPFARSICREIDVARKTIGWSCPRACRAVVELCSDVSHPDDFPRVFPRAVRARRDSKGARGRLDRDPGARSEDLDARPAPDGG